MKIALIGASGFIGSTLRDEALRRGHAVTALVGHPERLQPAPGLTARRADVMDTDALAQALRGHDAVLSAFSGHAQQDIYAYYMQGFHSILDAVKVAGVPRFLIVGGAASLETAPGKLLFDSPDFPEAYRPTAQGALDALRALRREDTLDWTMLSPAAEIFPGERSGAFRLGGDALLADGEGRSRISTGDYAAAMIDELETPAHSRQRFCVAY